jgi:hypothetical protein
MVQLLTFYLSTLADALEKSISYQPLLVRVEESHNWKWNMKTNHFKVKMMQKAYQLLWQVSVMMNESIDFALVDVFFVQCFSLLYQGYTLCIEISKGQANDFHFLSMFTTLLEMFSIHYHCQQSLNSVIFPNQ